ncbi:hypothetical protein [Ignatzschineria sp. LJL83]
MKILRIFIPSLIVIYITWMICFFIQPFYINPAELQNKTYGDIVQLLGEPTHNFSEKGFVAWERRLNTYTIQTIQLQINSADINPEYIPTMITQKNIYDANTRYFIKTNTIDTTNHTLKDRFRIWPFG